jgi:carbon monoxide dehydrogenase subunit G
MLQFEGDMSFSQPLSEVAMKLSDAGFLVNSLPETEVTLASPEKAAWKLRPKLSFITGALNAEMTRIASEPGKSAAFKVYTKAMGASSTTLTKLTFLEGEAGGTRVHWTGEVTEVTGLLKAVPKGLLQGTAQKVIEEVWAAVTARLNAGK